jgi:hypothetical protein
VEEDATAWSAPEEGAWEPVTTVLASSTKALRLLASPFGLAMIYDVGMWVCEMCRWCCGRKCCWLKKSCGGWRERMHFAREMPPICRQIREDGFDSKGIEFQYDD